jgi:hypothetical protein
MAYIKTVYQDSPSTATPLNAQHLNNSEDGIENNDRRLNALEAAGVVNTFNGRRGAVAPESGDYNIGQISPLTGAQVGQVPVVTNIGTEEDPELVFEMGAGGSGDGDMKKSVYDSDLAVSNAGGIGAFVSDAISDSEKDIYAVMDEMGAKNLIPYPYYESNHTESGITWTVNSDGSVTANGTATANSTFIFRNRTEQTKFVEKNTSYILSGCPSGGSTSKYSMSLFVKNQDDSNITSGVDYGDGITIDMPNQDYYGIYAFARVFSGQTASNLTFKPMLRLATNTSNIYQPYAMSNYELTQKIRELETAIIELGGN